ncbi:MAG: Rieske 2Fe-2S domain-containing protein [Rhodospirillaceae bacterium]|jgi:phthalate 4,5-dioxygenase|nr:Rieske 2Fe-2S domain-containing protein [Rhodospirillaceae bacterium]MBT4590083.1 Rieske 2Fe-2S domain-containing protein [Rhodospirillaceae bacterium]MBT4941332.1 Rieske 2Fe-2S domain-containing protein [Rhodospirillaceae bacterium]
MLSQEQNEHLCHTDAGTPMGDLFRRYWTPILISNELPHPDCDPVRVRVLGENLIAFRDTENRIGLIDEFCSHRGVSLWFGRNEDCGIRCPYHGWKFDYEGNCLELPSEGDNPKARAKVGLKSYPCIEKGGAIWTYMGPPELKPEEPMLEWTTCDPDSVYISRRYQECNYLQALEGGIDSSHVTWLHGGNINSDPLFQGSKGNRYNVEDLMPVFDVQPFEGGLLIGARRNADDDQYYWRVTPWIMPYHSIIAPRAGHPIGAHAWVPVDDHNCFAWSINYHPSRALSGKEREAMMAGKGIHSVNVPGTNLPAANRENDYLMDRNAQRIGSTYSGIEGIAMQDASLQESMGPIQDRTRENLCGTDNGVAMTRQYLTRMAKANQDGGDIIGLEPDQQKVRSVACELPRDVNFTEGAKDGLFPEPGSDPMTV